MTTAGAMVPSRAAAAQDTSRDARVKGDDAGRGDDDFFRDVMSGLADRTETRRDEVASGNGGTAAKSAVRSGSAPVASGDGGSETADSEADTAVGDPLAQAQTGPSLLEQVALALAVTPAAPAAGSSATETVTAAGLSKNEKSVLSASWQLLSALGVASDGTTGTAGTNQTADAASLALAALGVDAEDVSLRDSMTLAAAQSEEAAASFPAMKLTVTGEETHFAPVKSAEAELSRLLGNPAAEAGATPAQVNAAVAARDGSVAAAKDNASLQLTAAGEPAPVVAAGEPMGSRDGGGEPGGDRGSSEGQARATVTDRQDVRLATAPTTEFQATGVVGTATSDADSLSLQIARRIAAELANPASRPAAVSSGSDGAVKVLHLQLEPANLGSVTVRLALKDDVISVHLEASRHETSVAIEKDREILSNALKSAGYVVDNISSQPGDAMRMNSQQGVTQSVTNDGQMSSSLQSQSDSQQGLAQSGRGNQGDGGRQGSGRGSMPVGINESRGEGSRASGGALYV